MLVKFIPNILKYDGRKEYRVDWSEAKTLGEYIRESGFATEGMRIVVSGRVTKDLEETLAPHDEILLIPDVEIPVAIIAGLLTAAKVIFAVVAIAAAAYSVYKGLQKPRQPSFGVSPASGGGIDESSPTYGWDGIQTTQNVGTPVPVIYGEHRAGGNIINQFVTTDGDKNYLNTLIAICEGEIESIASIKINENASANFDGITTETKLGTNSQTAIPNFEDLHNLKTIDVALNTLNDDHVYTTVDSDVEAFSVHLTFPSGIYAQDSGSGSIGSWTVSIKIEYKLHTDPTYTTLATYDVSEKSRTAVRRIFSKTGLTAGQYDIRVTRTSATGDFYNTGDVTWTYLDEIKTDDLIYPNTALLGIKLLATDQLSGGVPNITALVKGKKVQVPDIRTAPAGGGDAVDWEDYYWKSSDSTWRLLADETQVYWDGTTYVTAYSANPIWCVRDLLVNNRFGLGEFIDVSKIDADVFLEMAKYADEKVADGNGDYEKRFRLDVVIDSSARALDVLTQLAATFRGIFYFSEGTVKMRIDKPESAVQLFGMGNIVKGSFNETWKSVKEVPNVVEVQFLDESKDYQQELVSYIDETALTAGALLRRKEIRLFCTRVSQAIREARYYLKVAKYLNRTITFRAGIDAVAVQIGDIISVAHDVPQWGYSGRVLTGSTTTSVKLDQSVTIAGGTTYKLQVRHSDDTIEEKTVNNAPGTTDTITVSSAFSFTPSAYDVYVFGVQNILVKPFRVMNLARENMNEVEIQAIEYDDDVYDDSAPTLPTSNYSALTTEVADVTNLALSEGVVMSGDGTIINTIDVWFRKPDDDDVTFEYRYKQAKIYISDNAQASWSLAGVTDGTHFQISGVDVGTTYYVAVVSCAYNGMENALSGSPSTSIEIDGKTTEPSDVTNFNYAFSDKLRFTWTPIADGDLAGYEIRDENANWGTEDAHLIYRGMTNSVMITVASRTPGTYYLKAYNWSGMYSVNAASVTPTNSAPAEITGIGVDVFFNVARFYWDNNSDADVTKYQVYKSETNAWAGEETLVAETSGKQCMIEGRKPRHGIITEVTDASNFKVDALAGMSDDYFNGDLLVMTSGDCDGDERGISDFVAATGAITLSSPLSTTPSVGDKVLLNDRAWVKVRAYDAFGAGTLSAAQQITFEGIDEQMLDDQTVTARKIYVACLSALSADMGCLTAGTIEGGTFQTGGGGQRLKFDSTGLYGYDSSCNQRLKIDTNGQICAVDIKLIDPACDCNYSYLSAGALKFHDQLGEVPYLNRFCSGQACAGCWVILNGWTTAPEVIVGVKTLYSYDSSKSGQCQQWNIYADNVTCYCTSATCYGYCFQVHAALQLASAQGSETVKNVTFGTAYVTTGSNVCSSINRLTFKLFCHGAAPANWCAGCLCFVICYRCYGCGTWQGSCSYTYLQPHANTTQLQTAYTCSYTLNLPSAQCWELLACQTGLSWHDSGIASGSSVLCTSESAVAGTACTQNLTCGITAIYPNTCVLGDNTCYPVSWSSYSCSWTLYCTYYTGCACACVWGCNTYACYGALVCNYVDGALNACICYCCQAGCWGASDTCADIAQAYIRHVWCMVVPSHDYSSGCGCWHVNFCMWNLCKHMCFCTYCCVGGAESCALECTYSVCDTYATQCILDSSGVLNWLAIAYG